MAPTDRPTDALPAKPGDASQESQLGDAGMDEGDNMPGAGSNNSQGAPRGTEPEGLPGQSAMRPR